MAKISGRIARTCLVSALAGALGACANMADTPPGTPISQVEAKFGRPDYSCPLPNDGRRLIWTMQPAGQYAWGTNVDAAGDTDRITPLLTDKHFQVLAKGVWTRSEERRVGKECVSTCRSGWSPLHYKKKTQKYKDKRNTK